MAALIIAIFPQNSSRGNWEEQQDRTDPNSQFELARKPAWLLAFRQFGLPKWKHDFECRTFDLSDNSPYISSVIPAPEECKKNTQERYEIVKSEPAQSPVRRTFSADETAGASKNFECCTFDHSDNSPCLFSSGFLSRNLLKNSLERKQERRQKIFDFEIFCVEEYQGESGGRNSQLLPKFRVRAVMTTSIPIHECVSRTHG